jgi:hypothetical protein
MHFETELRIIEFVARQRRVKPEKLDPNMTLLDGLGVDGEDAFDFFTSFSNEFKAFSSCTLSTGDVAVIAWLVPITRSESDFIRNFGWGKLEDALVALQPDLLDFNRKTAV